MGGRCACGPQEIPPCPKAALLMMTANGLSQGAANFMLGHLYQQNTEASASSYSMFYPNEFDPDGVGCSPSILTCTGKYRG